MFIHVAPFLHGLLRHAITRVINSNVIIIYNKIIHSIISNNSKAEFLYYLKTLKFATINAKMIRLKENKTYKCSAEEIRTKWCPPDKSLCLYLGACSLDYIHNLRIFLSKNLYPRSNHFVESQDHRNL